MAQTSAPERGFDDLTLGHNLRLDDLADREALSDLVRSFYRLFGISIRIVSSEGSLLADATTDLPLCHYLNTTVAGRQACSATVSSVRATAPTDDSVDHACFNGARYHIVGIDYDGKRLGRAIVGPYMPTERIEPPATLLALFPSIDAARTTDLFYETPRADDDSVRRLGEHVRACVALLLFSNHKTLVTSQMHLASVRENYNDLRKKNARLQEAVDRLREADRLKSTFLATVSHELRTPLTSIIGYSEMLLEGLAGAIEGEQREFVQTIHEKGGQLLQLITNLLDLTRLEGRAGPLKRRSVRVDDVLRDIITTLLPAARKKGVTLTAVVDSALPEQSADDEKLRQVFLNLTENALKFTPEGGSVVLSARTVPAEDAPGSGNGEGFVLLAQAPDCVEVRVADTGVGVPPSEVERVFEAFYQVDSSVTRHFGGSGLGLSIAKRLVDAHDGTIKIEPNQPNGAVFVVTLPIVLP